jgi:endonuclease YncB( thermonuclease family)
MRFLLISVFLLLSTYASAATITGKVIKVLDGDTIDILYNNKPERIRFNGIDAPEKGQPHGQKAKQFVLDLAANKIVSVNVTDTDRYGRSIGDITLPDGRNLNREVVRAGYAWHYVKYSDDVSIGELEKEARIARRGLWQDKDPMAPWDWRKMKRQGNK